MQKPLRANGTLNKKAFSESSERSKAESKNSVALACGYMAGFLDFARNDTVAAALWAAVSTSNPRASHSEAATITWATLLRLPRILVSCGTRPTGIPS